MVRVYHGEGEVDNALRLGPKGFFYHHGPEMYVALKPTLAEHAALSGGEVHRASIVVLDVPRSAIIRTEPHRTGTAYVLRTSALNPSMIDRIYEVSARNPRTETLAKSLEWARTARRLKR